MIYFLINLLIGGCLASHACVIYERTIQQKDFIFSRSVCSSCGYELMLIDEIPILSFILLKGKCRYCHSFIPYNLFLFEILGAISFIKIDFSNTDNLLTTIIFFFLLLISVFDWHEQEFPLLFLSPEIVIILFTRINQIINYIWFEKVEFLIVTSMLLYFALTKKIGTGDLLIYLVIALYFGPEFANYVLLLASVLLLIHYLLMKKGRVKHCFAFIPYLYLATSLCYFFY